MGPPGQLFFKYCLLSSSLPFTSNPSAPSTKISSHPHSQSNPAALILPISITPLTNPALLNPRLVAWSWSANSRDEIQGMWNSIVDLLRRRWRWGLCVDLVFCSQGREGIKKEKEEQREYNVLSLDLKNVYFVLWSTFFTILHTHTKHIFIFFEHWDMLFKLWYQTLFFCFINSKNTFFNNIF